MRVQTSIDWTQLGISLKELGKFNFKRNEVLLSKGFREDGVRKFYSYNGVDLSELAETGTYDIGAELLKREKLLSTFPSEAGVNGGHEYFDSYSKERLELLETLFDYLESKECSVIVNIMPIQPDYQKIVEKETNYEERIEELKTILNQHKNQHNNILLVMDNHKVEFFGGEANHFFDHIHPTSVNSDKMLNRIFENLPNNAF
ncbi:MAG: SGNH/GDSL hydrolase family protein [Flavobacteriales bacterium]|jgi:hypothetical protein|nr:SGNH/GDSL hydrolase family protein [Flavobacteriales bacterium]